jgi:hypothetical protein
MLGNRMRVKEEAKRGCGLISKGMVVYVGLDMWGRFSGLWLGKEGGGECERGPVEVCLSQEGWLLQVTNVYCKNRYICMCLSTSSLQALEDKMRGAATVHVDQRVVVMLEW